MKIKIIKYENKEFTVAFKSNNVEKLFGLKNNKKTYFSNGTINWIDGSKVWFEKETNKKYGRFKLLDDFIEKEFWD